MLREPLTPPDAKKVILNILKKGSVTYAEPHALKRMEERNIGTLDCVNVLRGGKVAPAEYENGSWRYRVCTARMTVVARFETELELEIVTHWRG